MNHKPLSPDPAAGTRLTRMPANLSDREIEVLRAWLLLGSKRSAAEALYLTSATVSTHIVRIRHKYAKVGRPAGTQASLLARALQDGFVALADL